MSTTRTTLAVFVAEKGEHVGGLLVEIDLEGLDLRVVDDLLVHQPLDLAQLVGFDLLEMGEIKARPVRRLRRAGLVDVRAENLPQRPVDEVHGAVVPRDRPAAHERHGEVAGWPITASLLSARMSRAQAGASWCRWRPAASLTQSMIATVVSPIFAAPWSPAWPPISA